MVQRPPTAHPRSRGENGGDLADRQGVAGSSPLTRGKLLRGLEGLRGGGLIPAHAGKTERRDVCRVTASAHPRSRGENLQHADRCGIAPGSSPLTRGKRYWRMPRTTRVRLIPAHAGKTNLAKHLDGLCWAHPRSRGENGRIMSDTTSGAGSSPLTRGKLARYAEA